MDMEFNSEDYRNWCQDKVAKNTSMNRELVVYGPETFLLYYFRKTTFDSQKQCFELKHVSDEETYNLELTELSNTVRADGSMIKTYFLPNYVEPTIWIAVDHHRVDGEGFNTVLNDLVDKPAEKQNRLS